MTRGELARSLARTGVQDRGRFEGGDMLRLVPDCKMARRSVLPSKFLQSRHLQFSLHKTLAWKHSQYFFRQLLFLQWQPLVCLPCFASLPPSYGACVPSSASLHDRFGELG